MPIVHAIALGATQGFSEFLPISSSGHLILVPWLFGWHDFVRQPHLEKTFDVALHAGTFVGAVIYFRKDLAVFIAAAARSLRTRVLDRDARMAWLLLASAIPGAIVGALFETTIEDKLGKVWLIGVMLIVFGLLLLAADRLRGDRRPEAFGLRDAAIMGLAQAAALQPGVSRSGITMTAGRGLRFDRDAAARLSFLMSLPIIGGAALYKGLKLVKDGGIPAGFGPAFAWGTATSAVTGFIAVWFLLRLVRTRGFGPFVAYRVLAGVAVIALAASSFR